MFEVEELNKLEKQVSFPGVFSEGERVLIMPWKKGVNNRRDSRVYLEIRSVDEVSGEQFLENIIVDRESFVAGILEVFPEIVRSKKVKP